MAAALEHAPRLTAGAWQTYRSVCQLGHSRPSIQHRRAQRASKRFYRLRCSTTTSGAMSNSGPNGDQSAGGIGKKACCWSVHRCSSEPARGCNARVHWQGLASLLLAILVGRAAPCPCAGMGRNAGPSARRAHNVLEAHPGPPGRQCHEHQRERQCGNCGSRTASQAGAPRFRGV